MQGPIHNADRVFAANGRNICSGMMLDGDDENHSFIANAPTDIDTLLAALDAANQERGEDGVDSASEAVGWAGKPIR